MEQPLSSPPSSPAVAELVVPSPAPVLAGRGAVMPLGHGPFAVVEALLKSPASLVDAIQRGEGGLARLAVVVAGCLAIVGVVTASFAGGVQFLLVPLKMILGTVGCMVVCFPSLHIFSCLSGARQSARETWGALAMGVGLASLLLLGFAPIAWVFSQATTSAAFVGAVDLVFLVVSTWLGLGLVRRTLGAMNGAPIRGLRLWGAVFMVVVFQLTTALRPLVGATTGASLEGRLFFLTHWLRELGA